ncbi:MAG: killer suppression protein HigA [Acidobacteriia bacterium]|nr:killer suppression protein HigA [Terriglobia bacterium]
MELAFETKSLRTICESEAQARLELGAEVAEILKHRLADMRAATCTNDLVAGQPRLSADGEQMVVDLCDGYRIVFKANHTRNPLTEAKDVDWPKVIRIKILRIESDDD